MAIRHARKISYLVAPLTLAAGLTLASSPAQMAAPAPAAPSKGLTLDGTFIDKVLIDGTRLVSYAEYAEVIEPKALADKAFLQLHADPAAVKRGHFAAFTSQAGSRAFQKANGLPLDVDGPYVNAAKGARTRAQEAASAARAKKQTLNGRAITLSACNGYMGSGAYMFDGLGCSGGDYISMWTADKIPNMGTYGWNDRISSAVAGTCIYYLKMFKDSNYLGTNQILYGPNHVLDGLTIGNQVSSATTPGTRC